MSSLVFPSLDVAAAGPTSLDPSAAGLRDPVLPAEVGFSFGTDCPGDDASSESSSIGSLSSDDDDDDEGRGADGQDECGSKSSKDDSSGSSSLGSLTSLQDSLPIKKGLSNHFNGKSRSFSNLSECSGGNVGDLAKHENPFNKRRRIQIANRTSYKRRASCSSLIMKVLPPLLSPEHALQEEAEEEKDDDDDSDDNNGGGGDRGRGFPSLAQNPHGGVHFYNETKFKKAALRSPRSLPLFDHRYV